MKFPLLFIRSADLVSTLAYHRKFWAFKGWAAGATFWRLQRGHGDGVSLHNLPIHARNPHGAVVLSSFANYLNSDPELSEISAATGEALPGV